MSEVLFCRTAHHYQTYDDFFTLAELSGYRVIPLSELDAQSDNTYIATPLNGEWMGGWDKPRARIIHWELEWRWDWRAELDTPPGVAEVWASDKAYAEKIGARYVLLGGHEGLRAELTQMQKEVLSGEKLPLYDLAFMAYLDPARRKHIYNEFILCGLKIAPNGWGVIRHVNLSTSRCMVHVHQFDTIPYIAPIRWTLAAAYSLPLISESVLDRGAFGQGHFLTASYEYLVPFTQQWLRSENASFLADVGRNLHGFLCQENTFRKCVEAAI